MRLKKGFTLAEILIVLMVIGVIATMTVPSMMKGVAEAQLKTGYKKAYNTITNFAAMERVAGTLPSRGTIENIRTVYNALNNSLSVKGYATQDISSGEPLIGDAGFGDCLQLEAGNVLGGALDAAGAQSCATTVVVPTTAPDGSAGGTTAGEDAAWIVTEDNMAFTILAGGRATAGAIGRNADTKQQIAAATSEANASAASSIIIVVDVNGLSKGPNTYEQQGLNPVMAANTAMATITGDQFKVYVGSDGATAGPRDITVTGRIAADLK